MHDNEVKTTTVCMQLSSNKMVYIENYRKLVLYTNNQIIINTKDCQVTILGNSLFISFYSKYEMIVKGIIESISFQ